MYEKHGYEYTYIPYTHAESTYMLFFPDISKDLWLYENVPETKKKLNHDKSLLLRTCTWYCCDILSQVSTRIKPKT